MTSNQMSQQLIVKLQQLQRQLPPNLPAVPPTLVQTVRNKLKLDELRKSQPDQTSQNYKTMLRYQTFLLENVENLMEEVNQEHVEITSTLEELLTIHNELNNHLS